MVRGKQSRQTRAPGQAHAPEAAGLLDVSPALFRKRLQLARKEMLRFMKSYCGLASDDAPCRCNRQVSSGRQSGRISGERCNYAAAPSSFAQIRTTVRQVEEARWALHVHRTNQLREAPVDFARRLIEMLETHPASD